jgi:hypothetical protein
MVNLSLHCINAVILLDASGKRVLAKYYGSEQSSLKEQKAFEKGLFEKTRLSQGKTKSCHLESSFSSMDSQFLSCFANVTR